MDHLTQAGLLEDHQVQLPVDHLEDHLVVHHGDHLVGHQAVPEEPQEVSTLTFILHTI